MRHAVQAHPMPVSRAKRPRRSVALVLLLLLTGCVDRRAKDAGVGAQANGVDTEVPPSADDIRAHVVAADSEPDSAGRSDLRPITDAAIRTDAIGEVADVGAAECVTDEGCDDGEFCNGLERCHSGRCHPSPTPPCRDSIECTADACDEATDRCTAVPDPQRCRPGQVCDARVGCFWPGPCHDDTDCDDRRLCNGAERCTADGCAPGEPPPV